MNFPDPNFFKIFKPIPGAIGCGESLAISWLASQAPSSDDGLWIDIGTNAGRAAMSAARGLHGGAERVIHCIDPVFDLSNAHAISQMCQKTVENIGWGWVKESDFQEKVRDRISFASNGTIDTRVMGLASMDAIPVLTGRGERVAWAFVDSDAHEYPLLHAECWLLKDRMAKGGIISFHDYLNQHVDVERVLRELLSTGKFEEIGVPWHEINQWIDVNVTEWTPDNASWHAHEHANPHFVGAVKYIG